LRLTPPLQLIDVKRALEVVGNDRVIGSHVDTARVGAAGFSAGGFTALSLGAACADPAHLVTFCRAHPDDGVCRLQRRKRMLMTTTPRPP
jgi:predicted dienelactone hydrolase